MDLSAAFVAHLSRSGNRVVFSGSDYGKVIPSVTGPRTFEHLIEDVNRYALLYGHSDGAPTQQTPDPATESSNPPLDPVADTWQPLPRPFTIKKGQLNAATFYWRHEKQRRYRERTGCVQENKTKHEQRTQALRTVRTYAKVAAEERQYIAKHAG